MGERFSAVFPSDRALEQAIVGLKKGAHILKYGRRGKPKLHSFRLSTDEKSLIWYSGNEEKQLRLSSVTSIIRGQKTVNFQKRLQPEREQQSFSLIYADGEFSLDLIFKDKEQADLWYLGLTSLIPKHRHARPVDSCKNRRAVRSCGSSPAGFIRRKHILGLLDGTPKISQKCIHGSPIKSFSERFLFDGLSCSSDNFFSESSISSSSPCFDPESPNKHPKTLSRFLTPTKMGRTPLRDVLMWGEGVEGGLLGGGDENCSEKSHFDALLPKILESTTMLDVQNIDIGGKHAALVTKRGDVFCWGEGKGGKLGHKIGMDINCPKQVEALNGVHVKSVYCGEYQTCALAKSGELYMWGGGDNCCYGTSSRWVPRLITGVLDGLSISSVACGEWHTAIVSETGQLFTFGDGTFGVLGHGNFESVTQPKLVESLKGMPVKHVACGPWHTAAIIGSGKLFTWGDGDKGRLGHSCHERKTLPTCVSELGDHDFVQVCCGRMLTVGLTDTGIVYTMGSSAHGQLGNPHSREKSITVVHGKLKSEYVREITCGSYHIAVLTSRGNVYTWGRGVNGQLGLGDTEDRDTPTLVEALRGREVERICCGSSSTVAICLHQPESCTDRLVCRGCGQSFGFMRKKHNCYNCGLLFCSLCSSKKIKNASFAPNESKSFRVCNSCFKRSESTKSAVHSNGLMKTATAPEWDSQSIDSSSLLSGRGLPRWGEVSSPSSFRKHHSGHSMSRERDLAESDKIISEEVEKLKAKAEILEKLSERRGYKIQSCQQRVDETRSSSKKEATKRNTAKEAIRAFTSRLYTMSPKASAVKEAEAQVGAKSPRLVSACTNSPAINSMRSMFSSGINEVLENRRVNSFCDSALSFSNKLTTLQDNGEFEAVPTEETFAKTTGCGEEKIREKDEWIEHYQPGVYITLVTLPSGQRGLKRVRFSKRRFTEREAERWWEEHEDEVYEKYDIDGYVNPNQESIIC